MKRDIPAWLRWLEVRVWNPRPAAGGGGGIANGGHQVSGGRHRAAGGAAGGAGGAGGRLGGDGKNRSLSLLLLALLGIALMVAGSPRSRPPEPAAAIPEPAPAAQPVLGEREWGGTAEAALARGLEEALGRIHGVGRVHVLVTLETSARQVFAGDVVRERRASEEGVSGGQRTSREERENWRPVLVRAEDGRSEKALVEAVQAPRIRGVLVVADGGGDPRIRRAITQAVEAVTGIGAHRVVVLGSR